MVRKNFIEKWVDGKLRIVELNEKQERHKFYGNRFKEEEDKKRYLKDFDDFKIQATTHFPNYRKGEISSLNASAIRKNKNLLRKQLIRTTSQPIRLHLLREAKFMCSNSNCRTKDRNPGLNKNGLPNLEINHIDGNRENGYKYNLEVICRNCHGAKTEHIGSKRQYE